MEERIDKGIMTQLEANIKDLKFDDKNFNKHTEYGMSLLEKSLRKNGAGRSILIDKDNNIIAGNGIVESAGQIGLDKVKIVETSGDEIIAVKRTDLSLKSKQGREMALADNATASADLEWDFENILSELDAETADLWGITVEQALDDDEFNNILETSSDGLSSEFDDSVDYNLGNLFRKRADYSITELVRKYSENGGRPELIEVFEKRLAVLDVFNFDELAKLYRSQDSTDLERELLEKLFLVFITSKKAFEDGLFELNKITGNIYDKTVGELDDGQEQENVEV